MRPFYVHFADFPRLKKFIDDKLHSEHKRIEELIYSYVRIEYSSLIKKHKSGQLGLAVLDYLNEAATLVARHACMLFFI